MTRKVDAQATSCPPHFAPAVQTTPLTRDRSSVPRAADAGSAGFSGTRASSAEASVGSAGPTGGVAGRVSLSMVTKESLEKSGIARRCRARPWPQ